MASPAPDPLPPFEASRFHTRPLGGREHLVEVGRFAKAVPAGASAAAFLDSLPDFLGARALRGLVDAIVQAHRAGRPVVVGLGGHVVKTGLGPLLVDLAERRIVTGFVLNGAAAIHDAEVAWVGSTSEDVGGGIFEGRYGNAHETGQLFADAAREAATGGLGLGTALGRLLVARGPAHPGLSLLCAATRLSLPVTVHVAIGTDTVHMHPACDGAALGAATHRDFLRLCALVERMDGGVYLNVGSAVVLPEVFMKAVAMVHNADPSRRVGITTGNLDMLRHYRPRVNVVERPAVQGFDVAGHHEINLPLLRLAVLEALARPSAGGRA
ncbi:MAG: hypothetical protein ACKOCB_01630 [Planctomycetia bacterium]